MLDGGDAGAPGWFGPRGMMVLFLKQVHLQNVGAPDGMGWLVAGAQGEGGRKFVTGVRRWEAMVRVAHGLLMLWGTSRRAGEARTALCLQADGRLERDARRDMGMTYRLMPPPQLVLPAGEVEIFVPCCVFVC